MGFVFFIIGVRVEIALLVLLPFFIAMLGTAVAIGLVIALLMRFFSLTRAHARVRLKKSKPLIVHKRLKEGVGERGGRAFVFAQFRHHLGRQRPVSV